MKILEVIPLLSVDGGAESLVVYLCNEFIRQGHECAILTLYDLDESIKKKIPLTAGIQLYTVNKKKGLDVLCSFRLRKIVKQYSPDVVHVHVGAIPYIIIPAFSYKKCKCFATIHSEARREAGSNYQKWIRQLLFKTGIVKAVTISESSKKSFEDFYKITPSLIYNGVPGFSKTLNHEKVDNKLHFIHVARCHPIKNQELLLRAFNQVLQNHDNIELNWFGTSSEYPELFESLKPLFNDQIHYLGSTSDARLEMSKAEALCLSSKMEGMPMTIIEALSVGCIPICTPVGGCVNMIEDGVNGFLSADMSVEAYSETLERFIETNGSKKEKLRNNAIESFNKHYSIEKTANDYISLFSK